MSLEWSKVWKTKKVEGKEKEKQRKKSWENVRLYRNLVLEAHAKGTLIPEIP